MANPNPINTKGMKYNKKPNEKHKEILDSALENGGNMGKAIKEAGYSDAVAKTPQKITGSKSWDALMEEYLPDQLLQEVHADGLLASRKVGESLEPDHAVRKGFLDTAYKLKDKYPAQKKAVDLTTKGESLNNLKEVETEELRKLIE